MKRSYSKLVHGLGAVGAALVVALVPAAAFAAKEYTVTLATDVEITYLVNTKDKIARVKRVEEVGPSSPERITIPDKVKYKENGKTYTLTVIGIGERALASTWFTKVKLPDTIEKIGKEAFDHASVEICDLPANLERIEDGAFKNSWLKGALNIPAGCTYIGETAFTGTAITSINFIDNGQSTPLVIGEYAFSVSALQSVSLNRVQTLGEGLFSMCDELRSINISGSATAIPRTFCYGCKSLTQVGIPVVESIGEFAFMDCESLREFPFMPGLRHIGDSAFESSGLTSARLKAGCETLGDEAFFNCQGLQAVEFPASMLRIGDAAFQHCDKITYVSCDAVTPPAMTDAAFEDYRQCTIWVPQASVEAYEWAKGWRCFDYSHLKGSGVGTLPAGTESTGLDTIQRFDLQGRPIPAGRKPHGLYIEVGKKGVRL